MYHARANAALKSAIVGTIHLRLVLLKIKRKICVDRYIQAAYGIAIELKVRVREALCQTIPTAPLVLSGNNCREREADASKKAGNSRSDKEGRHNNKLVRAGLNFGVLDRAFVFIMAYQRLPTWPPYPASG